MNSNRLRSVVCVCLLLSPAAIAQMSATLRSSVSDATGVVIPGVTVTAGNINAGYLDWNGTYSATFTNVQIKNNTVDTSLDRVTSQSPVRSGTKFVDALFYDHNNLALSSQTYFQNLTGAEESRMLPVTAALIN